MRVARLVLSFLLILVPPARLNSQQSGTAPQRDPQALAIVAQMAVAAGWATGALPTTIIASGTLIRFDGDQQQTESFTLKQRGPSPHRLDLLDSGAITSTIVKGLARATVFSSSDGIKRRFNAHAPLSFESPAFPFFSDVAKTADYGVDVQDLGTDTIDGLPCHGVYIARHAKTDDSLARFRDLAAPLKVWISLQSNLPVRIDFIRLADNNPYVVMHFSRSFSDYRVVNGIAVAFQQDERFEGQLMYRFQFTNVHFNATVADSDFDLSQL